MLEDNFHLSSISTTFTTLLILFNATKGDKKGLHEFCSQFEGQLGVLSHSLVDIPQLASDALPPSNAFLLPRPPHTICVKTESSLERHNQLLVVADTWFMDELWFWESRPSRVLPTFILALRPWHQLSPTRLARKTTLCGSGL